MNGNRTCRPNRHGFALRELRVGGFDVTALHSHMLHEEPRLFFTHLLTNEGAVNRYHTASRIGPYDRSGRRRYAEVTREEP